MTLARELYDSVEPSRDRNAAFNAEIRRRVAEIEAGTAKLTPVAEFIQELRNARK